MTDHDKEILLEKMLDSPAELTDKELREIMSNDELLDIYNMSAAVSATCANQPEINSEDEWRMFRPRIKNRPMRGRWVMRVAAIFFAVAFLSSITVKIIDAVFYDDETLVFTEMQPGAFHPLYIASSPIEKECEELPPSPPVRKPKEEIDIEECILIEQARIDNDIALHQAALYEEEYTAMIESGMEYETYLEYVDINITIQ